MASPGSGRLCSVSSMFESCVLRGTVVSGDTAAEASQLPLPALDCPRSTPAPRTGEAVGTVEAEVGTTPQTAQPPRRSPTPPLSREAQSRTPEPSSRQLATALRAQAGRLLASERWEAAELVLCEALRHTGAEDESLLAELLSLRADCLSKLCRTKEAAQIAEQGRAAQQQTVRET